MSDEARPKWTRVLTISFYLFYYVVICGLIWIYMNVTSQNILLTIIITASAGGLSGYYLAENINKMDR